MLFNINEKVRVKLNDKGRQIHREYHEALLGDMGYPYTPPKEDADGWSEWQLWVLMQEFGPSICIGMEPPFETNIEIPAANTGAIPCHVLLAP